GPATAILAGADTANAAFTPTVAGVYRFTLRLTNSLGGSASAAVSVTVNTPPTVSAGPSRIVRLNTGVFLTATASDADGDLLGFAWTRLDAGPGVTLFNTNQATMNFTPVAEGAYIFRVNVTDGRGGSAASSVTVTASVSARLNNPPIVFAGPNVSVNLGGVVSLRDASATDPDGDPLTYAWSFRSVPANSRVTTASIGSPATLGTVLAPDVSGLYRLTLTARDNHGGASSSDVLVRVIDTTIQDPPSVIVSLATTPVNDALNVGLSTSGTTAAISVLEYQVSVDRRVLDFTGTLVGPAAATNFNETPVQQFVPSILDVKFQSKITASTISSGLLERLLFSAPPDRGAIPPDAVSVLFVSATANNQIQIFRPTADAGISQSVGTTTVQDRPSWPDPLAPASSNLRPFLRLDGRSSSDPNLPPRPFAYQWSVMPGSRQPSRFSGEASPIPTFTPSSDGTYAFGLVVSNGILRSPTSVVEVAVNVASRAPTAAPIATSPAVPGRRTAPGEPPLVVTAGSRVVLDGSTSADAAGSGGGSLKYIWRKVAGPGALSLRASAITSFVPQVAGVFVLQLVVRNSLGLSGTPHLVTVIVRGSTDTLPVLSLSSSASTTTASGTDLGEVPELAGEPSLRVGVNDAVMLSARVFDPDVVVGTQLLSFFWKQTRGVAVAVAQSGGERTSSTSSVVSFSPPVAGVYEFECRVRELDPNGASLGVEVAKTARVIAETPLIRVPLARVTGSDGQQGKTARSSPAASAAGLHVTAGSRITLDGSASNSATAIQLGYRWVQVLGPEVVLSNPFSAVTTFVVPDLGDTIVRSYAFQLFVEDSGLRSEPAVVAVTSVPPGGITNTLTLRRGLNLISVPLQPFAPSAYTVGDLARDCGSSSVVYAEPGPNGAGRFRVWTRGLAIDTVPVRAGEAYVVQLPLSATVSFRGLPWPSGALARALAPGLNLVGIPMGASSGKTAEDLRSVAGSSFVARSRALGEPGLEVYIPGPVSPFSIESGRGYLVRSRGGTLNVQTLAP
ncbi:MAG: hypothetical protein HY303_13430, partial [Candidatus Wallbacteria bacterium]|nr:hypothetical protein [Candidatus Wallbacteria bacterium]